MATPVVVAPNGETVAVNEPVGLSWSVQEPQAAFQVRVRTDGASTWDALDLPVTAGGDPTYLLAADALTPGEYEWQAGVISPTVYPSPTTYPDAALFPSYTDLPPTQWSASAFFPGRLRPAAPVIVAPADGETIDKARYVMRWTPADLPGVPQAQTRFRARRLDRFGKVREDSGDKAGTVGEFAMSIADTDVWRTFEVQVFYDGLWSPVASREVYVFFVGPPFPTVEVAAVGTVALPGDSTDAIRVAIINPAPVEKQPAVDRNEVHRRVVGDVGDGIRIAAALPPDATFLDYTPASGVPYAYRVVAIGTDGNPTSTDWQE